MILQTKTAALEFVQVALSGPEKAPSDTFARKVNKTVAETVAQPRYHHLREPVERDYAQALNQPLGPFLLSLKQADDPFYRAFLNACGDEKFCRFSITDHLNEKGLYAWVVDGKEKYVGRSHDPFGKRVNRGYGWISPKNCYLDGRSTNCRLNSLIATTTGKLAFFVHPMTDDALIDQYERELIQKLGPEWNKALKLREA